MSFLEKFEIELANEYKVYEPGEKISGKLVIKAKERQIIDRVYLELNGEAYIHWQDDLNNDENSYHNQETYLKCKKVCLEKPSGDQSPEGLYLEIGERSFPFEVVLPASNLPTSFECKHARIRYWIQAVIEIPWMLSVYTHTTFTVVNKIDLALMPNLLKPTGVSENKVFFCGPCRTKPIEIKFDINKSGFVSGESVVFNVTVNNHSKLGIKSMTLMLVENVTLHTLMATHKFKRVVTKLKLDQCHVLPGAPETRFTDLVLKLPVTCPSLMNTCRIIKNNYTLELKVHATDLPLPLPPIVGKYLKIPIVIGTVPVDEQRANIRVLADVRFEIAAAKSRGKNNDAQIKRYSYINFFEPLYPIVTDDGILAP